jgi:hypothetical protein
MSRETPKRPSVQTPPRRSDATRDDGRLVRKKTLYLIRETARALELRAVQDDTTESQIVEDALRAFLGEST